MMTCCALARLAAALERCKRLATPILTNWTHMRSERSVASPSCRGTAPIGSASAIDGRRTHRKRGDRVGLVLSMWPLASRSEQPYQSNSLLLNYVAQLLVPDVWSGHTWAHVKTNVWTASLNPRRLCTLHEFIESRFDTETSVRQLATVIGLGPQRFIAVTEGLYRTYAAHLRYSSANHQGWPTPKTAATGFGWRTRASARSPTAAASRRGIPQISRRHAAALSEASVGARSDTSGLQSIKTVPMSA
jgi:hypothetical protein